MRTTDRKLIAFVVYPGVTPLDLVGPLTVLRDLKVGTPYRTVTVSSHGGSIETDTPLGFVASRRFDDVRAPFALFVPGAGAAAFDAMHDPVLLSYIRAAAAKAEIVGSTGNGALVLAAAGLLAGRRAAAHWAYRDILDGLGATSVPDGWIEDGKFLTAAGGAAGIDAMLHLTAKLRRPAAARLAQLWMEYDPQPPFGRLEPVSADSALGVELRARRTTSSLQEGGSPDGAY